MIVRIVRMEFDPEKVEDFLALFNRNKQLIRHFPGVQHLELHRDATQTNVFYTYSIWNDEDALEAYRHSDLFKEVWKGTKALFSGKPLAYSLIQEQIVE